MPLRTKRPVQPVQPTTDPEWERLSDEELALMTGQRANSERIARQASRDLKEKMKGYQLAINLYDLSRMEDTIRGLLLGGKLDTSEPKVMDRERPDETALVFVCDLLTAATCCDIIRSEDRKLKQYPTRVYRSGRDGKAWTKLVAGDVLTKVHGKEVCLVPEHFPKAIEKAPEVAKEPQRVDL